MKQRKYELINWPKTDLKRLVAVRRVRSDVKAGDLGGFVEGEHNLSHQGECWIEPCSEVTGDAIVCDNAYIEKKSLITDTAVVCNNSSVDYSTISGDSVVCDKASVNDSICEDVMICDSAKANKARLVNCTLTEKANIHGKFSGLFVDQYARLLGGEDINKEIISFNSLWNVTITDNHIRIGCKYYHVAQWFGFRPYQIRIMSGSAYYWWYGREDPDRYTGPWYNIQRGPSWRKKLLQICVDTGRYSDPE